MSALGYKRTFHAALRESALPPKADIGIAMQNVRLVPKAAIWEALPGHVPSYSLATLGPNEPGQVRTNQANLLGWLAR